MTSPGCGSGSPTKRSRRAGSAGTPTETPPTSATTPTRWRQPTTTTGSKCSTTPSTEFLSVYTGDDEHIGEVHLAVEESLGDGQLSILIGRSDLWHRGYGTAALHAALGTAFKEYGLFRVWVDIPEYNEAALSLFRRVGFVHEGTLRKSRPHEGSRFDSVVMGMLAAEYEQRTSSASS